jgi:hypothetical protein
MNTIEAWDRVAPVVRNWSKEQIEKIIAEWSQADGYRLLTLEALVEAERNIASEHELDLRTLAVIKRLLVAAYLVGRNVTGGDNGVRIHQVRETTTGTTGERDTKGGQTS